MVKMAMVPQNLQMRTRRPVLYANSKNGNDAKVPTNKIKEPERPESWKDWNGT